MQGAGAPVRRFEGDEAEAVVECDAAGVIRTAVGALPELVGHRPDEVVGLAIEQFVHPRNLEVARSLIEAVAGKPHLELWDEVRVRLPDGSYRWVEASVRGGAPGSLPLVVLLRTVAEPHSEALERRAEPSDRLAESERRFRALADASPIGIFLEDAGECVYVNPRWEEITGMSASQALVDGSLACVHPDDRPGLDATLHTEVRTARRRAQAEVRVVRGDGALRHVRLAVAPYGGPDRRGPGTIGTLDDITDTVRARRRSDRLAHVLEATSDLVCLYEFDDQTMYLNEAAQRFYALPGRLSVTRFLERLSASVVERWANEIEHAVDEAGSWSGELVVEDHTGRAVPMSVVFLPRRDGAGRLLGLSTIGRDMTERKELEARLEHQATHDPLTGLPNRLLLDDRLGMALARAGRAGTSTAVLFCDLDRFKVVNDSLGHALGDRALVAVAGRLSAAVRPGDTVARFGGDEFVVVAEDVTGVDEAERLARRLAEVLQMPVGVGPERVVVSISIGIVVAEAGHGSPDSLLRDADAAMYHAKAHGRARHAVFSPQLRAMAVDRLDVESALREGLDKDELTLHYQPQFDLATGRVVGVEALVRWVHPVRGLLDPDDFLPIAADAGLLPRVGAWVVDTAFREIVQLRQARGGGEPPLLLCVNLSGAELADPSMVDTIARAVEGHGVDPGSVDIELTEHALMDDLAATSEQLRRLKDLGFRIAVDDFGTGHSSLAYLRRFPVDLIKIDRTFVEGLGARAADEAIVRSVLTLADALGLRVIAEGVSSPVLLAELRRLGCAMAQGYHLAAPMSRPDLERFLAGDPRV